MPTNKPNAQTVATAKYQKRVGLIAKSYKLHEDVVKRFAAACEAAGVTQAAQVTKMMEDFIKKTEKQAHRNGKA